MFNSYLFYWIYLCLFFWCIFGLFFWLRYIFLHAQSFFANIYKFVDLKLSYCTYIFEPVLLFSSEDIFSNTLNTIFVLIILHTVCRFIFVNIYGFCVYFLEWIELHRPTACLFYFGVYFTGFLKKLYPESEVTRRQKL